MFGIDHGGFIIAAWGIAALVLVGLLAWVIIDHKMLRTTLDDLESRGLRRRSARRDAAQGEGEAS